MTAGAGRVVGRHRSVGLPTVCALLAALLGVMTAGAVAEDAVPTGTADEAMAAPRWMAFVARLQESHWPPVDPGLPAERCRSVLAAPPAGATTGTADDAAVRCIRSVVAGLDPGGSYLTAQQLADQSGRPPYVGVGIEMALDRPTASVRVVAPIANGPAARAGLRAGDRIVAIDGTEVGGKSMDDVVRLMRGAVGSTTEFTLRREGLAEPVVVAMRREEIRIAYVRSGLRGDDVAWLRISQFRDESYEQLGARLNTLAPAEGRRRGIVLDLRACPGGSLAAMQSIGELFGDAGASVATLVSRGGEDSDLPRSPSQARASLGDAAARWVKSADLVVLVDHGTGSGAEAVVQFLRESRHAVVVGARTFGLALVHQRFPVGDGAVVIAVSEMRSPGGVRWHGTGLAVDVDVTDVPRLEFGADQDAAIGRAIEILHARRPSGLP